MMLNTNKHPRERERENIGENREHSTAKDGIKRVRKIADRGDTKGDYFNRIFLKEAKVML